LEAKVLIMATPLMIMIKNFGFMLSSLTNEIYIAKLFPCWWIS
jgi:hypothetical protein